MSRRAFNEHAGQGTTPPSRPCAAPPWLRHHCYTPKSFANNAQGAVATSIATPQRRHPPTRMEDAPPLRGGGIVHPIGRCSSSASCPAPGSSSSSIHDSQPRQHANTPHPRLATRQHATNVPSSTHPDPARHIPSHASLPYPPRSSQQFRAPLPHSSRSRARAWVTVCSGGTSRRVPHSHDVTCPRATKENRAQRRL
jgi:hypothetical protein